MRSNTEKQNTYLKSIEKNLKAIHTELQRGVN